MVESGMLKVFILVLALVAAAVVMLSVNILLKKNGRFRSEDVGQSRAMRERGIGCTRSQDRLAQADSRTLKDMER